MKTTTRKTYLREVFDDETLRDSRTRAIKTSSLMVEITPHSYVNQAAAIEHRLISSTDKLLEPNK
jgi:hypothetical protein